MSEGRTRIYLAGSFYPFRDKIEGALSDKYDFSDPRTHRQSAIAKLVVDDMTDAVNCPVCLVCFPRGRSRGTMTYAEAGASMIYGNKLITVDENEDKDLFLKEMSYLFFTDIDDCISHLKDKVLDIEKTRRRRLKKEKNVGGLDIYLCGSMDYDIKALADCENRTNIEKRFILQSANPKEDLDVFDRVDLTVVHFPHSDTEWIARSRIPIFFMGVSWAYNTPIILVDENPIVYPPLAGLSRRIFSNLDIAKEYLERLDSLDIDKEAKLMYYLLEKYKS